VSAAQASLDRGHGSIQQQDVNLNQPKAYVIAPGKATRASSDALCAEKRGELPAEVKAKPTAATAAAPRPIEKPKPKPP
jgi:hypothetical protein